VGANSRRPRIPPDASLSDHAGFVSRSQSGSVAALSELAIPPSCRWPLSGVILSSARFGRKVLTPGLISCLDSPRPVFTTWAPLIACDLQEASSTLVSFSYAAATRVGSVSGLPGGLA